MPYIFSTLLKAAFKAAFLWLNFYTGNQSYMYKNKCTMKKYAAKITMMLVVVLLFSSAAQAQFVVKIRPAVPVLKVRPVCPSPGHIWVSGNYVWHRGQYVYSNGYWAAPKPGHRWVEGYWKKHRGGWVWVPSHWRR